VGFASSSRPLWFGWAVGQRGGGERSRLAWDKQNHPLHLPGATLRCRLCCGVATLLKCALNFPCACLLRSAETRYAHRAACFLLSSLTSATSPLLRTL